MELIRRDPAKSSCQLDTFHGYTRPICVKALHGIEQPRGAWPSPRQQQCPACRLPLEPDNNPLLCRTTDAHARITSESNLCFCVSVVLSIASVLGWPGTAPYIWRYFFYCTRTPFFAVQTLIFFASRYYYVLYTFVVPMGGFALCGGVFFFFCPPASSLAQVESFSSRSSQTGRSLSRGWRSTLFPRRSVTSGERLCFLVRWYG